MTVRFRWLLLVALLALFLTPLSTLAQGATEPTLAEVSVTIPANGETTISFQAYCLDFGEPFPTAFGTPSSRAADDVLRVVKTALLDGTADEDPLALQLSIWSLREGETLKGLYPNLDSEIESAAQALLDKSESATVAALSTDRGTALDAALKAGTVSVTSSDFKFVDSPVAHPEDRPYHGEGTMTIKNLTSAEVTIYYPVGMVLTAQNPREQDVVTYATELETQPIQQPTTLAATGASASTLPFTLMALGLGLALLGAALTQRRAIV